MTYQKLFKEINRYKQTWSGEYRHIRFSIVFWTNESMERPENSDIYRFKGIWNSYISIQKDSIPKEFDSLIPELQKLSGRLHFRYGSLDDYFNMAGGLTFFDLIHNEKGIPVAFKVGNDYNHIWNEYVDFVMILSNIKHSIDCFIEHFPNYKAWSFINGHWVKASNLEKYNDKLRNKK